jgi:hypothetical protein
MSNAGNLNRVVLPLQPPYARVVKEWTRWFRARQEAFGTQEDFAHASGIKIRMVSNYRAGTIPRPATIRRLEEFFNESSPPPGLDAATVEPLEARIAVLERQVAELNRRWDELTAAGTDPDDRRAALAGLADDLSARDSEVGARGPQPKRKRRGS